MQEINFNLNQNQFQFQQPLNFMSKTPSNSDKNLFYIPKINDSNSNLNLISIMDSSKSSRKNLNILDRKNLFDISLDLNENEINENNDNNDNNENNEVNDINKNNLVNENNDLNNNEVNDYNNNNNHIINDIDDYSKHENQDNNYINNNNLNTIQKTSNSLNDTINKTSNPLLQYVMVGVKSTESIKNNYFNYNGNNENNQSDNNKNITFNMTRNAKKVRKFIEKEKITLLNKSLNFLEENKDYLKLFSILVSGGLLVMNMNIFLPYLIGDIKEFASCIINISLQNENILNSNLIKEDPLLLCLLPKKIVEILSTKKNTLLSFILLFILFSLVIYLSSKYQKIQDEKIAREDYDLIKDILKTSRNKEDNCDAIGIFEFVFVKENSQKRQIDENTYRNRILPKIVYLKENEDIIKEAEIYIQDQELKVWKCK
jgi:hypothetical protein